MGVAEQACSSGTVGVRQTNAASQRADAGLSSGLLAYGDRYFNREDRAFYG